MGLCGNSENCRRLLSIEHEPCRGKLGRYSHTEEQSRTLKAIPIRAELRQDLLNTDNLVVMCGCKLVDGKAVMLTKVSTVCLRTPGWVGDVSKHSSKAM